MSFFWVGEGVKFFSFLGRGCCNKCIFSYLFLGGQIIFFVGVEFFFSLSLTRLVPVFRCYCQNPNSTTTSTQL